FYAVALPTLSLFSFFSSCSGDHRGLHSFPTRRSSDLQSRAVVTDEKGSFRMPELPPGTYEVSATREGLAPYLHTGIRACGKTPSDRKSTRLNSSHQIISYAVFCLKKQTRAIIGRRCAT